MFTKNDVFEIAVKMEKNGENIYNAAVQKIDHRELKSMLQWMADEETSHARWFMDQQNRIRLNPDEARLKEMVPQVLQDMMGEKTLGLDDIDFESFASVPELLDTFIGFEQDTIQFYELLEMFIDSENARAGLDHIISEEQTHIEKLKTMAAGLREKAL